MMLLGGSEEASVMLRWAEVRVPSERDGRTNKPDISSSMQH